MAGLITIGKRGGGTKREEGEKEVMSIYIEYNVIVMVVLVWRS